MIGDTGTANREIFLWLWRKVQWRLNSSPEVAWSHNLMHQPGGLGRRGRVEGEIERNAEVPEIGGFQQRSTYVSVSILCHPVVFTSWCLGYAHFPQTWGRWSTAGHGELGCLWRTTDILEPVEEDLGLLCCLVTWLHWGLSVYPSGHGMLAWF